MNGEAKCSAVLSPDVFATTRASTLSVALHNNELNLLSPNAFYDLKMMTASYGRRAREVWVPNPYVALTTLSLGLTTVAPFLPVRRKLLQTITACFEHCQWRSEVWLRLESDTARPTPLVPGVYLIDSSIIVGCNVKRANQKPVFSYVTWPWATPLNLHRTPVAVNSVHLNVTDRQTDGRTTIESTLSTPWQSTSLWTAALLDP